MALPSSDDVTRLLEAFKFELSDETSPFNAVSELSATLGVFIKRDRADPTMEDVLEVKSFNCVLAFAAILLSTSAFILANSAAGVAAAVNVAFAADIALSEASSTLVPIASPSPSDAPKKRPNVRLSESLASLMI